MAQTQNLKLYMFKIPFYKYICLFLTEMQNVFYAKFDKKVSLCQGQRYTYRVLQTIQMKLILLCVWAEPAVLGSNKTALKFKYEI